MPARDTRLADVRRLLKQAVELELSAGAVQHLKWFVYAIEHDDNVSLACRHFGIARSTFIRWWNRFDATDIATLEETSRRPHSVRAPETDAHVVELIRALRMEHPTMGKVGIHALLRDLHGIQVSASTVGRVIARHKLFFAPKASHVQKRRETNVDIILPIFPPARLEPVVSETSETGGIPDMFALPPLPTS